MALWETIADTISQASGQSFRLEREHAVGGGCINSTYRIEGHGQRYFVKLNDANRLDMFEAEADGLRELREAEAIRVPAPLCTGVAGSQSFIVLENIDLGGRGDMRAFARQLAELHRHQQARFGWYRDNTIGSTHQPNDEQANWVEFWREQRLGYQLELATRRGGGSKLRRLGDELLAELPAFFESYLPVPSLLHGDLWSGNYAMAQSGEAVIFDPAVYYGDREADIAMTELFGGFGRDFYEAYNEAWPLDAGYSVRKSFYNLYHILNHCNMFGGGYCGQAERMMGQLLSELR